MTISLFSRSRLLAAGGILVLGAGILGTWLFFHQRTQPSEPPPRSDSRDQPPSGDRRDQLTTHHMHYIAWDKDDTRLYTIGDNRTVAWNTASGDCLEVWDHSGVGHPENASCPFSPDVQHLAVAVREPHAGRAGKLVNQKGGETILKAPGKASRYRFLSWSPDSRRLVLQREDQAVFLWNAETGGVIRALEPEGGKTVIFSPRYGFVHHSAEGERRGFSYRPGAYHFEGTGGRHVIRSLHWHSRGHHLLTVADDGLLTLWDAATGREIGFWTWREGHAVQRLTWSPTGRLALLCGGRTTFDFSNSIQDLWPTTLESLRSPLLNNGPAGEITILDVDTGAELTRLKPPPGLRFQHLAWTQSGRWLATFNSAKDTQSITLWDADTGEAVKTWPLSEGGQISSLECSPDDKYLALTRKSSKTGALQLELFHVATGKRLWDAKAAAEPPGAAGRAVISWSPDSKHLIVAGQLWAAASPGKLLSLTDAKAPTLEFLAWSPSGNRLATIHQGDQVVKVWDPAAGKEVRTLSRGRWNP